MAKIDSRSKPNKKCEDFLASIDHLDAQIAASSSKLERRKFERAKSDLRRQFATYLDENTSEQRYWNGTADVWTTWLVAGVPPKKRHSEANAWMRARSRIWRGWAPDLREEVRRALERNESVPAGYFGLHVERTVEIDKRLTFDGSEYSYDQARR